MLPADGIRRYGHRVEKTPFGDIRKVAAIYGGNGSGKSNLVKALNFLKNAVIKGEMEKNSLDKYSNKLFKNNKCKPIYFEIKLIYDRTFYEYVLEFDASQVLLETLKVYDEKKERKIIDYKYSHQADISKEEIKNDINLSDNGVLNVLASPSFSNKIEESERQNLVNFLLAIFGLDIEKFNAKTSYINQIGENEEQLHRFKELVCTSHTGINTIKIETHTIDNYYGAGLSDKATKIKERLRLTKYFTNHFDEFDETTKEYLHYRMIGDEFYVKKLVLYHKNEAGELVQFSRDMESDGTKRFLDLVPQLLNLLYNPNAVLVIDEIENSIHPALLKEFMKKLLNFPVFKGQLIFTTHESNLLDQDIFRQDEIWFAEKDEKGFSTFHPLSDYEIRNDLDIQKGYLNGRFGGVPFLANFKDLNWNTPDAK